jgi:glutaredoxin 3
MSDTIPTLYIKGGCPWCDEAENYLQAKGIKYNKIDVRSDSAAFDKMIELSGQSKAPTLEWDDEVLADFGTDQLEAFLQKRNLI